MLSVGIAQKARIKKPVPVLRFHGAAIKKRRMPSAIHARATGSGCRPATLRSPRAEKAILGPSHSHIQDTPFFAQIRTGTRNESVLYTYDYCGPNSKPFGPAHCHDPNTLTLSLSKVLTQWFDLTKISSQHTMVFH